MRRVVRFVSDDPPDDLVERAARVFTRTDGDIREVVRTIVTSDEFFARKAYRSKVKSPFEVTVSALRALGARADTTPFTAGLVGRLGQQLYGHQAPNGWPETGAAWINTGALLNRMNFALQLVAGGQPMRAAARGRGGALLRPNQMARMPIQIDVQTLAPDTADASRDRLVEQLLAGEASSATKDTLARAGTPQQLIALTLGSPEFQRR